MRNSNTIRLLLHSVLVIVPLILLPYSADYFYYPKILVVYVLVLLMIGVQLLSSNRRSLRLDQFSYLLLLLLVLSIVSIVFSDNPVMAIWGKFRRQEGLYTVVTYALLFLFSRAYFRENNEIVNIMSITAVLVSVYGICQYYGIDPIPRDEIRFSWVGRAFSTMGNPNFLGSYLVLMLPLSLFLFLKQSKVKFLIVSSLIYWCLLLTFTRSALLGCVVILGVATVFVFMNKKLWKPFVVLLITFVGIAVFVNESSNGNLSNRFLSIGKDTQAFLEKEEGYEKAGANRGYIWLRTIDLIQESPWVGYGLENLETHFVETFQEEMIDMYGVVFLVDRAHNEYLHIAVSSGIPALIVYLVFIWLCLKRGFELLKLNDRYLPYLTAVLAYLVQAFFNISVVSVAYIFWIFLGVIVCEGVFGEEGVENSNPSKCCVSDLN